MPAQRGRMSSGCSRPTGSRGRRPARCDRTTAASGHRLALTGGRISGGAAFTLTLDGTGSRPGWLCDGTVLIGGRRSTSPTRLRAAIPATDLADCRHRANHGVLAVQGQAVRGVTLLHPGCADAERQCHDGHDREGGDGDADGRLWRGGGLAGLRGATGAPDSSYLQYVSVGGRHDADVDGRR